MPDPSNANAPTLCFGCRAIAGAPKCPSDAFPGLSTHLTWERFECENCGVSDLRVKP